MNPYCTATMENTLHINYYGYFTPFGGYGIANINWVKYLRRQGVDVSVHAKFAPQEGSLEWNILSDEEREMFNAPFEKRKVGIIESNPFDFDVNISEYKIANTMCESDHVAPIWAEKLNTMQQVIVPNEFNKETFTNSGVKAPITVIPHGVDTSRFQYICRPEREIFTFGILGYFDMTDRKGVFDVIQAFTSEFNKNESVQLLLKTSNPSFGYYNRFTDPRIKTITKPMSFDEVFDFYKSIDCFVFPSKAEGVGYPPREAMATGLPVILTKWSGLDEIAKPEIAYPLKPKSFEKRPNFIEQDGVWAKIDIQELMYQMRHVYEHRQEAVKKGIKAASHIKAIYDWSRCTSRLISFLKTI